jgi:hypothetical protein
LAANHKNDWFEMFPATFWLAMNGLTIFGLFAVTAMLVCYALEDRSPWLILGFAVACALGSVYGFLQLRVVRQKATLAKQLRGT